ncbi:nuclear transport factor 2 family protein [Silvimonas iriomotensis]|uniref:DUF4440 domain-containing protein n=1 Tax=Silvimonas iriomotensis TaxID=449662 RepID=A0ABQ2P936_9NEIS|nr:DUF4440 domain-containing protein [Silvimonas iriomotensis]GGP20747.1 DUF4440 domain-containing protein [Silvimonas iriomotensis]
MLDAAIATRLIELETALHQPATRQDAAQVSALLADDFCEIGYSGRLYDRAIVLAALAAEPAAPATSVYADQFVLTLLAPGLVLLTYRSATLESDGALIRHALRSSVWRQRAAHWQMVFHQGTPTAPFQADLPAG